MKVGTAIGRVAALAFAPLLVIALLAVTTAVAMGSSVQVARSGWSWGNPTPQGNALSALDFHEGVGYAVGAAGTALRTNDGGSTWSGLATGTSADLTKLQIIDPNNVVILGGNGCVLRRSSDGGATFLPLFILAQNGCPNPVQSFYFVNGETGYLLLRDGSVLRTGDGGKTFSKQTAIPGTPASATGGGAVPADLLFTGASTGIAFVGGSGSANQEFSTTDGGVSWKPAGTIQGGITKLYRFDANTIYGVGPGTLLLSTDGGSTFTKQPIGGGTTLNSIHCTTASTCLIATSSGTLLRTTDGGQTATTITASSVPLADAAFFNSTRAVAVGAAGQTVLSDDAGVNYSPVGGGIGGSFSSLRAGSNAQSAFASGVNGQIAFTINGGAGWQIASVPTSAAVVDTSWPSASVGYALDAAGGLFSTANGGASWQTLSPGAGPPARAVLALANGRTVALVGPTGVKVAIAGGPFQSVSSGPAAHASLNAGQAIGSAIFVWGTRGRSLLVSGNAGKSWRAIKLPSKKTRIAQASFPSATAGYLLDSTGRLWATSNGGRSWRESLAIGSSQLADLTFGSPASGYLRVNGFGGDSSDAYVLHTANTGRTWVPQAISRGSILGLLAVGPTQAYALLQSALGEPTPGGRPASSQLFFTSSGGVAGTPSTLSIKAGPGSFTKKKLKKARSMVTISGRLSGAVGGEQVVIGVRALSGGSWSSHTAIVGANGGSFSTRFRIHASAVFVAQWAGESGRAGAGSAALTVNVKH
ncbi:MAG TPA: hypothetical protein VIC06_11490 [Solirubrobacteraceae bacterium]|jgi:photosystem II stability/assembly factor-like uncharacterized protein